MPALLIGSVLAATGMLIPATRSAAAPGPQDPTVTCATDPNIFNTGYDAATGGVEPNNSLDANWEVAGPYDSPAGTSPETATYLPGANPDPPANPSFALANVGNLVPGAWSATPYSNAQWISQQTIASPSSPNGDWYYEYNFNLDPSVVPSSFSLAMNFMSDNEVATVFVNNVDQSQYPGSNLPQDTTVGSDPYDYVGYHIANASETTLDHNWQTGANTIIVQMKSGPPEEGFDAQVRPSALCPVSLAVAKTASPDPYSPGQRLTYTVTVTNSGPGYADEATVSDPLPAALAGAGFTWTCGATSGSSCTASGSGNISDTVDIASGGTLTYTVSGTVPAAASGTLTNTVTVTPPPGATDAGCSPNCSSTSNDPESAPSLSIAKSVTSSGPYDIVGQTISYQFVVTNTGNVALSDVGVNDVQTAPAGALASGPTCQSLASPGGTCSGSTTSLSLGQVATFTASYTITQADLDHGSVSDTATATGEPPGCSSSSCATTSAGSSASVDMTQSPALTIVKSVTSSGPYDNVGQPIAYQFVVKNTGNVTLGNVGLNDVQAAPAGALTTGPTCQGLASPAAPCSGATTSLAPGQVATFSATYTITQADLDFGSVSDTATAAGDSPGCSSSSCATTSAGSSASVDLTQTPGLVIVKSVTSSGPYDAVGQIISYEFAVTNSGNVTLSHVGLTDVQTAPAGALTSGPTCQSLASPPGTCSGATTSLSPGQVATFTATYTITQADLDNGLVSDTATATGDPPGCSSSSCGTTSPGSSATVGLTQSPALTVVKSVTSNGPYDTVGQTISYQFVVTNSGNVTLSDVGVTDVPTAPAGALASGPSCESLASPPGTCSGATTTLSPGQVATFTATYSITQADLDHGSVSDTATATGDPPSCSSSSCATGSPGSGASVGLIQLPSLTVAKSVASSGPYESVGETITYQFAVTNSGNVTLSDVGVTDVQTAPAGALASGPSCQSLASPPGTCSGATTTLSPGQVATFTATYTITQADLDHGSVSDSATATGDPPGCGSSSCATTSRGSSATVGLTQTPGLSIVKSVTSSGPYDTVAETISYEFAVTNSGNVTLSDVGVTDVQTAPAGALTSGPSCQSLASPAASCSGATTALAPGQVATFTATYTITQADLDNGSVSDTATATGEPPGCSSSSCATSSSGSSASVAMTQSPALTVVKSVTPSGPYDTVGETISYQFAVTNSGNVTLSDVGVTDVQTAPAGALTSGPSCQSLASPAASCSGATTSLAPGQVATFTATYTITQADLDNGSVSDTATATGEPPGCVSSSCATSSAGSTATVTLTQSPALTVVKSVTSSGPYDTVGETISYRFTVTNSGNVTLGHVGVLDVQAAPAGALTSGPTCQGLASPAGPCSGATTALSPRQVATFTATYTITQADLDNGSVSDTATATGEPPDCSSSACATTSAGSTATVTLTQSPALTVVKSSPTGTYSAVGQTIVYDFLVTNTGNVTLHAITVTDTETAPATQANLSPVDCPVSTLAPGAHEACSATYTVTLADLQHGSVKDTATASGDPPGSSTPVTSAGSSATVRAAFAAVTLTKAASTLIPGAHTDDTFVLTAENAGPSSSGTVVVTDVLARGLEFVSSSAADGSVSVSGQTVKWTIPDLAPSGAASKAVLSVVVAVDTTSPVSNSATFTQVTRNGSGGTTGKSNVVTITPTYAALVLTKTVADASPLQGKNDTYAITVLDKGPNSALGIVVTDPLPLGMTFVSASASTGTVSEAARSGRTTVTWDVGTLEAGAHAALHIIVKITAASGSIKNTADLTDQSYDPTGQTKSATALAAVAAPVVVPPAHTGEPWSSLWYWLLVIVLMGSGVAVLESGRRRRRYGSTPQG
ncbi:MAG: hypothetical protein ACLQNG_05575 [Acidimicrobiales bacterium]